MKLDPDDRLWLRTLTEDAVEAVITAVADRAGASAKDANAAARFGRNLFREMQRSRLATSKPDSG